jgi:hypothetical protein
MFYSIFYVDLSSEHIIDEAFSILVSRFSNVLLGVKKSSYFGLKVSSIKEEVLRRSVNLVNFPYLSTSESDNFLGVIASTYLGLFCLTSPENSVTTSR